MTRVVRRHKHFRCSVPGCTVYFTSLLPHLPEHEVTPHFRCACGWVGVSWRRHRAQRSARGFDTSVCRLVGPVGPWRDEDHQRSNGAPAPAAAISTLSAEASEPASVGSGALSHRASVGADSELAQEGNIHARC